MDGGQPIIEENGFLTDGRHLAIPAPCAGPPKDKKWLLVGKKQPDSGLHLPANAQCVKLHTGLLYSG